MALQGKTLNQLLTQVTVLDDAARLYVVQSSQDSYMLGSTLKALVAGGVTTVGTYAALPASPTDGKLYWVNDASGDPELSAATGALYFYQLSTVSYIRVTSEEELAGAAGDMLKSVYDSNDDAKVDAADSADEIAGGPTGNQYWGTDGVGNQLWLNNTNLASGGSGSFGDYTPIFGTTHQVAAGDSGKFNSFAEASLVNCVIPTNAVDPIEINREFTYYTEGAGGVQFDVTGLTIRGRANANGNYAMLVSGSVVYLKKIATNTWAIWGDQFGVIP